MPVFVQIKTYNFGTTDQTFGDQTLGGCSIGNANMGKSSRGLIIS